VAIEVWETEAFKSRFRDHSPAAALDWPSRAVLGNGIFVYDPADWDPYLAGERIQTEFITWASAVITQDPGFGMRVPSAVSNCHSIQSLVSETAFLVTGS
jgi:hypothetical protein